MDAPVRSRPTAIITRPSQFVDKRRQEAHYEARALGRRGCALGGARRRGRVALSSIGDIQLTVFRRLNDQRGTVRCARICSTPSRELMEAVDFCDISHAEVVAPSARLALV